MTNIISRFTRYLTGSEAQGSQQDGSTSSAGRVPSSFFSAFTFDTGEEEEYSDDDDASHNTEDKLSEDHHLHHHNEDSMYGDHLHLDQSSLYVTAQSAFDSDDDHHMVNRDWDSIQEGPVFGDSSLYEAMHRHKKVVLNQFARNLHFASRYVYMNQGQKPPHPSFSEVKLLSYHNNTVRKLIRFDLCMHGILTPVVLSLSDDGDMVLWHSMTGHMLCVFRGHTERVTCAMVWEDKHSCNTCYGVHNTSRAKSSASNLDQQDTASAQQRQQWMNRKLIISGSSDKSVRIWDPLTGKCLHEYHSHRSGVNCLAKVDDDHFCSVSDEVCIWEISHKDFHEQSLESSVDESVASTIERVDDEPAHCALALPEHGMVIVSSRHPNKKFQYDDNGAKADGSSFSLVAYPIQDLERIFMDQDPYIKKMMYPDDDILFMVPVSSDHFVAASRNGILSFWNMHSLQGPGILDLRNIFNRARRGTASKSTISPLNHVSLIEKDYLGCCLGKSFVVINHKTRKAILVKENAHEMANINRMSYLPGRNLLVTCSDDSRIRLWSTFDCLSQDKGRHNAKSYSYGTPKLTMPPRAKPAARRTYGQIFQRNKNSSNNRSSPSFFSRRRSRSMSSMIEDNKQSHQSGPKFFHDTNSLEPTCVAELSAHTNQCLDVICVNDSQLISAGGNDVILWQDANVTNFLRQLYSLKYRTMQS